jgi:hypothetical protein
MSDTKRPNIQGEGDYESARRYDEATKRFVEEGKVGPAAERSRTDDPGELADLQRAEDEGRARAKEEDRLLNKGAGVSRESGGGASSTGRAGDARPDEGRSGGSGPGGGSDSSGR